ncbi:MAG: YcfA family protein [Verrucomicrobiaceae bacterium]|nr:YcfA family protein [Verrucomicrobiaceae bacterium]
MKQVSGKALIQIASRLGCTLERVKGSHHIMSKDGEEDILVIPVHANRPLKTGTLRALMKTAGITEADL